MFDAHDLIIKRIFKGYRDVDVGIRSYQDKVYLVFLLVKRNLLEVYGVSPSSERLFAKVLDRSKTFRLIGPDSQLACLKWVINLLNKGLQTQLRYFSALASSSALTGPCISSFHCSWQARKCLSFSTTDLSSWNSLELEHCMCSTICLPEWSNQNFLID